jgi:glucose-1-phosphate thymidylyltransferase
MRGIILAGGHGTRLSPLTKVVSKQLLPVYNKPMIYYPLSTLMLIGIREILVISSPKFLNSFKELLGDGQQFGINLFYESQPQPNGIAEAITIGKEFILGQKCALILGDNLLYGPGLGRDLSNRIGNSGATILAYQVANPTEFGTIEFDSNENPTEIIEKPKSPKSNWAIPGLYFYDESVTERVKNILPSNRGEIEITDLNKSYLKSNELKVIKMPRGTAWLDLGNPDSLLEAAKFIQIIENRQGIMIGEPSEVAKIMNWI